MKTVRLRGARLLVLSLLICSHSPLIGCNDESRTSGTQVVESPEAVAYRKSKVERYKGGPPKKLAKALKRN
jgi:hypothetical protein